MNQLLIDLRLKVSAHQAFNSMEPPSFLPARPSTSSNAQPQPQPTQAVALALRSALMNPYSQTYSSHYAQAYMQQYSQATNAQGYTLSPTYNPNVQIPSYQAGPSFSRSQSQSSSSGASVRPQSFGPANSSWYQAGHDRCNYKNCTFSGSSKSVEIHKMDRHLIYPPGWQKKPEWDTDPSLKGKPIPIQGTNLLLNSPEAIKGWIEERKKRWPSRMLIEEKKRKFEEASARGELSVEALGLFSKKRRRPQESEGGERGDFSRRGRGKGRGGRDWLQGTSDSGWGGRGSRGRGRGGHSGSAGDRLTTVQSKEEPVEPTDGSSSGTDDEPEVLSSKPPPQPDIINEGKLMEQPRITSSALSTRPNKMFKKPPPQPKRALHNPFAARTSLLRNLLLPEIEMTVSNLSQAIRFLVDNDFLDGVELKPGEASGKLIQIVDSETTS